MPRHPELRGRAREIAELSALLTREDVRFVTVSGLPGVGRHSLVRHVMTLPEIKEYGREIVLVNDDHRGVDELLDGASLCVVAVNRAPSSHPQEHVIRVQPFTPTARLSGDDVSRHPGVTLFLDVASSVGIAIPDMAIPVVAEICDRVGGIPLAIELVAARSLAYSPVTLLELVTTSLPSVLAPTTESGSKGDPGVLAAIGLSVAQVDPAQRQLLDDLAVFSGPAPLSAIDAVCGDYDGLLDGLSAMVDAHLIDADHESGGSLYSLPQLVRAYLAPCDHAQNATLARAHQLWALRLASTVAATSTGELGVVDPNVAKVESDLRMALTRATAAGNVDGSYALAVALAPVWLRRGPRAHDAEELQRVVRLVSQAGDPDREAMVRGWTLLTGAELANREEEVASLRGDRQVVAKLAATCQPAMRLRVLALLVRAARPFKERSIAVEWCNEGIELADQLGDVAGTTRFEIWAAMLANQEGRLADAVAIGERALRRARHADDPSLRVAAYGLLATLPPGSVGVAVPAAHEIAEMARAIGDDRTLHWMLAPAAMEATAQGEVERAASYAIELLEFARRTRTWVLTAPALMNLAQLLSSAGDLSGAARLHGMAERHLPVYEAMLPPGLYSSYSERLEELRVLMGDAAFARAKAAGSMLTPSTSTDKAISVARGLTQQTSFSHPELSKRELEVLAQLVAGGSNKDLARHLGISAKTVMHHTSSIYRKLGVRGRAEAVATAVAGGLVAAVRYTAY